LFKGEQLGTVEVALVSGLEVAKEIMDFGNDHKSKN